jgi:hypothetical protein
MEREKNEREGGNGKDDNEKERCTWWILRKSKSACLPGTVLAAIMLVLGLWFGLFDLIQLKKWYCTHS